MNTETLQEIQTITDQLIQKLDVQARSIIEVDESNVVKIKIEALNPDESLGVLIGHHGDTLQALQIVFSLIINRSRQERLKIAVDVDEYRRRYEENLRALARRSAEKALFLKEPVSLMPMSPSDRRIIHLAVSEIEGATSESAGEDRQRRVVIKPA